MEESGRSEKYCNHTPQTALPGIAVKENIVTTSPGVKDECKHYALLIYVCVAFLPARSTDMDHACSLKFLVTKMKLQEIIENSHSFRKNLPKPKLNLCRVPPWGTLIGLSSIEIQGREKNENWIPGSCWKWSYRRVKCFWQSVSILCWFLSSSP